VFGCGLLEKFGIVFAEGGGIAGILAAGLGGTETRRDHEAASVYGVDRHLVEGEEIGGLAELIFETCGSGEGVLEITVGEDIDREGTGEPDEIFATWNTSEITSELIERVESIAGAELELEGLLLGIELLEVCEDV